MRAPLFVASIVALTACSSDEGGATPGPDPEPTPLACEAWETPGEDGSCLPPGVGACGEGFAPDGFGGCVGESAEPCPAGTMALVGETSCRPVSPCGDAPWGAIPVDPTTQHVDAAYPGADSDGSEARPWTTLDEAVDAAQPGAIVAVASGTYDPVTIAGKAVRLWGRCPIEVTIAGAPWAVSVGTGADGTEIRGVGLVGDVTALTTQASHVVVEEVWVHDTPGRGLNFQSSNAAGSGTVRNSLVEDSLGTGVFASGMPVTVERSVIRNVTPDSGPGRAIRGRQDIDGVVLEGEVILRSSVIAGCSHMGVDSGVPTLIEDTLFKDIGSDPDPEVQAVGRAVQLWIDVDTGVPGSLVMRRSVTDGARLIGVIALGAEAVLEDVTVRADAATIRRGLGVEDLRPFPEQAALPGSLRVVRSRIEGTIEGAVSSYGSNLTVSASVVEGAAGAPGIYGLEGWDDPTRRSVVSLEHTRVASCTGANVAFWSTDATVSSSLIEDARTLANGQYGDGIGAMAGTQLSVANTALRDHARIGLFSHESAVELFSSIIDCSTIDLSTENGGEIQDGGANACGCEMDERDCQVLTTMLGPPPVPEH